MIGVDTNVLVRLLALDDGAQASRVRSFFAQRNSRSPAFISAVVLMETLWVLQRRLRFPRDAVLEALRKLLAGHDIRFEHGENLKNLLAGGNPSASDIADRLIAWSGEAAGCARTVTLEQRAAATIPSMELLA